MICSDSRRALDALMQQWAEALLLGPPVALKAALWKAMRLARNASSSDDLFDLVGACPEKPMWGREAVMKLAMAERDRKKFVVHERSRRFWVEVL